MTTLQRLAWGLSEVSECTGLSVAFLRAEVRAGRLPVRRFGRRVLVRDEDLKAYLLRGSEREPSRNEGARRFSDRRLANRDNA
ncbi:MAG: helix-turn-helix domain-containing protein [Pyrinomonadaceae bacterium]